VAPSSFLVWFGSDSASALPALFRELPAAPSSCLSAESAAFEDGPAAAPTRVVVVSPKPDATDTGVFADEVVDDVGSEAEWLLLPQAAQRPATTTAMPTALKMHLMTEVSAAIAVDVVEFCKDLSKKPQPAPHRRHVSERFALTNPATGCG
jgi:hypothetical protein